MLTEDNNTKKSKFLNIFVQACCYKEKIKTEVILAIVSCRHMKNQVTSTGFEPRTSAMSVQCSIDYIGCVEYMYYIAMRCNASSIDYII